MDDINKLSNTEERSDAGDLDSLDEGELNGASDQQITLDKADRSLSELHRWHKSGRIIINTEWQLFTAYAIYRKDRMPVHPAVFAEEQALEVRPAKHHLVSL